MIKSRKTKDQLLSLVKEKFPKVLPLSDEALRKHAVMANLDKDFVLLYAEGYDGVLMTQEAYEKVYKAMSTMERVMHYPCFVDAAVAHYVSKNVLTEEEV